MKLKSPDAWIVAAIVVLMLVCGWYLYRHPEVAMFDEAQHRTGQ